MLVDEDMKLSTKIKKTKEQYKHKKSVAGGAVLAATQHSIG